MRFFSVDVDGLTIIAFGWAGCATFVTRVVWALMRLNGRARLRATTGASGSNEIRFNTLIYPNNRTIANSFSTPGGMNDLLNRVAAIQDTSSGTTTLASHTYVGLSTVVRIACPQPSVYGRNPVRFVGLVY
jgi:hypothetical protein